MQDRKMFQNPIQFPEQEQLKCPRCDSSNTKFCYYNNYNLSQPRHFCKNCKRYWTKGGSLRNIPIGGGTRKTPKKRSSSSSKQSSTPTSTTTNSSSSSPSPTTHSAVSGDQKVDQEQSLMVDMSGGSFSSVLGTNEQFGSAYIEEGLNANGSNLKLMQMGDDQFGENVMENGINNGDSYMSLQSGDDWDGSSGCSWPDLANYTPGSSFHQCYRNR